MSDTTEETPCPIAGFGITGFRTLDDVHVVSPGPVTVICGPNNTGKSSFLEALQIYPTLVANLQSGRPQKLQGFPDALSGSETARIAFSLTAPAFVELLSRHSHLGKGDPEEVAAAGEEVLSGPLWLYFKQGPQGWALEEERTLKPLQELFNWLHQPSNRLPPGYLALTALGTSSGQRQAATRWVYAAAECLEVPFIEVIRDVRRAADKPLEDEDLWRLSRANARRTDGVTRVEEWADTLERILQDVFGDDVRYEVRRSPSRVTSVSRSMGRTTLP